MLRAIARVGVNPTKIYLCRTVDRSRYSFRSWCSQAPNGVGNSNGGKNKPSITSHKATDTEVVSNSGNTTSGAPDPNPVELQEPSNGIKGSKATSTAKPATEVKKWTTDKAVEWAKGIVRHIALAIDGLKQKGNTADQQRGQQLWSALLAGKFKVDEVKFTDKEGSLGYITLDDGLSWLLEESPILFERQCDKDLFELIAKEEELGKPSNGVVLTGNPGIGKSWALMYFLYRYAAMKRTVVYHHARQNRGWLFRSDGSVLYFNTLVQPWPKDVEDALDDRHTIYLFDPAGKEEPGEKRAFTIVASSPNPEKNYKVFFNRVNNEFKMPCWSEKEIGAAALVIGIDTEKTLERFKRFGGIPRYLFSDKVDFELKQEAAVQGCNLDKLLTALGNPEALYNGSHKIVQYIVESDYKHYQIGFASPFVQGLLMDRLITHEYALTQAIGLSTRYHSVYGGWRGPLFEATMHREIPKHGHLFNMRDLQTGLSVSDLTLPKNQLKIEAPRDLSGITFESGVYYRPIQKNFGAVDAIVRYNDHAYGFQATVGEDHPINQTKLWEIIRASGVDESKFFFIFVVPRNRFNGWKKQNIEYIPPKEKKGKKVSPEAMPAELAPPPPAPKIKQFVLELPWAYGTNLEEGK